jgi:WD40 repeat protein/tRNA A-37 threonylcarbamoyl transferase component Bud32
MENPASFSEPTQPDDPVGAPRQGLSDTVPAAPDESSDPNDDNRLCGNGVGRDQLEPTIGDVSAESRTGSTVPLCQTVADSTSGPSFRTEADSDHTSSPPRPDAPTCSADDELEYPRSIPSIPGYEILGVLGRGGMGVVYKGRQVRLKRPCALKMILAGAHATKEAAARFIAEAEAIAQLQHPNIIQIHHIGESDGLPFFEIEYAPGGSLDQMLDGTPWPPARAAGLAEQLARGIAEAHRLGILHRDLKPANVLLAADGTPKISDFGLAKAERNTSSLTGSVSVMGSPSYMAPEQASGKTKQAGPSVDIYAIGATLYELLTGRPPFRGTTPLETIEQVRALEPVPPSRLVPNLPRDIETICLKCLQKEPARRYPSALALADDLCRFQAGKPVLARRIGGPERAWRWCRRNPMVAGLAGGIGATLVFGAIVSSYFALRAHHGEKLALQKATEAQAQAALAGRESRRANEEARHAREARQLSERRLYIAEMNLAERALHDGNTELMLRHLDAYRPTQPAEADLRGFEWHYLRRQGSMDLRTLRGHTHNVMGVAFDPKGARIVSASEDGTLKLWDSATGRELRTLSRDSGNVLCVAFSPDGRSIASGGFDRAVTVWDVETGQPRHVMRGHSGLVLGVAFSPDGCRVASSSHDRSVKLWDVRSGQELRTFYGHTDQLWSVTFSPDGRLVGSAGDDQTARLWDAGSGAEVRCLRGHSGRVWGIAFSPDGALFLTGGDDRTVRLWNVASGAELSILSGHVNQVYGVAFSPTGRYAASASADHTIKLWDLALRRELRTFSGHSAPVLNVTFSPDGRRVASASNDQTLKIWDTAASEGHVKLGSHVAPITSVAYSPDGHRIATGGTDRWVKVWDTATMQEVLTLRGHSSVVSGVAFSRDGRYLVSAGYDGTVRLWDARTGAGIRTLFGHTERITSLAVCPDGRFIASAGADRAVRIWDTQAPQAAEPLILRGHSDTVNAVAISPDCRLIATASADRSVKLWDAASGRVVWVLDEHRSGTTSLAFSPDGRQLASGGEDHIVRLWDAATGHEQRSLRGHSARVLSVAYSLEGQRVVSTSDDTSVIVWDAVTGLAVLSLRGHSSAVSAAAFRPDGLQIASASADQTLQLWDAAPLDPEQLTMREARSVVEFLSSKSRPVADVVSAIRNDPSLSEPVRTRALALTHAYARSLTRQEAQRVVHTLYNRAMLQSEVLQGIHADRSLSEPVRKQAVELAEAMPEDAYRLNAASWAVVRFRDRSPVDVHRALRSAEAACRLLPKSGSVRNTLGLAQYRAGHYADAVDTLTRSAQLNTGTFGYPDPADLAFLSLATYRLGYTDRALEFLHSLRETVQNAERARDEEAQDFLHEAESIELDLVFPADPFAR